MQPITTPAPSFTLEPTLPWLRTDPTMQQPEAFVGMRTIELNKAGWAPMSTYFPGGAVLAAVQIHKLDDLTPGVYWHENTYQGKVYYSFGRFEGFGELTRTQGRAHKQGRVHIELGCDNLDCDLLQHLLREDGTTTCFVNFGHDRATSGDHRIWRITHYVDMLHTSLLSLGADEYGRTALIESTGLTEDQERWLEEENQLRTKEQCSEYSACILGDFPQATYRAVLLGQVSGSFGQLFGYTKTITASQAKKRKSGAVAITWRSYAYDGQPIGYTQYYKLEDARVMLEYLQGRTEVENAMRRLSAAKDSLLLAGADIEETINERIEATIKATAEQPKPRRELAHAA